jgi:hypothetical protein
LDRVVAPHLGHALRPLPSGLPAIGLTSLPSNQASILFLVWDTKYFNQKKNVWDQWTRKKRTRLVFGEMQLLVVETRKKNSGLGQDFLKKV